jgi:hypothetical protein
MESQDNTNAQLETTLIDGNSALHQISVGENTNELETSEPQLENSADVPGEKESDNEVINSNSSTSIENTGDNENSTDIQVDKNSDKEIITQDASRTSKKVEDIKDSSSDSEKDDGTVIKQETLELTNANGENEPLLKERKSGLIDQGKKIVKVVQSVVGMQPSNEEISNNLVKVLNWMNNISKNNSEIYIADIHAAWDQIKEAWELIKRLLEEKTTEAQKLETEQKKNKKLSDELNQRIPYYRQEIDQKNDQIANLKQEKQDLEEKLETNRTKLVSALASVNRNTGTHYDGTSDRPQHHVLTGEYKTLKEQHLDPLANSLFTLMATSNPELKQQRREKVNDIKADISAIVLIGGQAMMRGESTSSIELPSGMLNEMQNLFCQKLPIFDINQLPQVSELLTKAANLAQGKVQYHVPGKWQEDDFNQARRELTEKLCQKLHLNFTSLNQDIQTEIQQSINNALIFLQRANLADSPAFLSLDSEGAPFRFNYHEAAKGYDDEGKIIKAIYPVYLVNSEAKVKAIVLTEPTTTGQRNPDIAPNSIRYETLSLTGTSSTSLVSATKSSEINEDEKEKIISQGILKGKRESLIKNVRTKFIDVQFYYGDKNSDNALLEKLANITSLEIIEQLEDEFLKAYQLKQFQEKVTYLVG